MLVVCALMKRFPLLIEIMKVQLWKFYLGMFKLEKAKPEHCRTPGGGGAAQSPFRVFLKNEHLNRHALALCFPNVSPPDRHWCAAQLPFEAPSCFHGVSR